MKEHPVEAGPVKDDGRPEYLVCKNCNNRLKENYEYFYLLAPQFGKNEVIGKCSKCGKTFNRELT